jgi:hypothetical protein
MAEEKAVMKRPGHRFAAGHPHFPRKPKVKVLKSAVETAQAMGFDAIALMLEIIATGYMPEPDGRFSPVSLQDRIKLLREASQYLITRPPATVTATVDSRTAVVDLTSLMMNPEISRAAEILALAMVELESTATEPRAATSIAGD